MDTKRNQYRTVLSRYLPTEYIECVIDLLIKYPVVFKVVKPRKTKLGDFRATGKNHKPQITINGNLNPYAFLITTLHEFAHLITYLESGSNILPHGKEWQHNYRKIMLPVIDAGHLPKDLEVVVTKSLVNVKASSCSDIHLNRALQKYDSNDTATVPLESLDKNSTFALNGKYFTKGVLRRTRFLCTENNSKKQYLVNALAPVIEIKDEQ